MWRTLKYTDAESGRKLGEYLKSEYGFSIVILRAVKQTEDGILLNGKRAFTNADLCEGDEIEINLYECASKTIKPIYTELDIVYEDEDVMVINKPPYMPTHPSLNNHTGTLANGIMYHLAQKGEDAAFHAVNRLDKNTSGLMVAAKHAYAHSRLASSLHTRAFERGYLAVVHGKTDAEGTVDRPIRRKEGSAIERVAADDGKRAVTHYKTVEVIGGFSLVELRLETGRTHQIRVHMSCISHPLVGDFLYGEEDSNIVPRQMLHSSYLSFVHPVSGEKLTFTALMSDDMREFLKKIKDG